MDCVGRKRLAFNVLWFFTIFSTLYAASDEAELSEIVSNIDGVRTIIEMTVGEEVLNHIDKAIDHAVVQTYPFPHIVVENIFPDAVYKLVCGYFPNREAFTPNGNRLILPITYGCSEQTILDKNQRTFWRLFGEILVNKYIKPKITDKLIPFLNMKEGLENYDINNFDPRYDTINFRQDGLFLDLPEYQIGLHIDQRILLSAMLIYLPSDDQHQFLGTSIYSGPPCLESNNYQVDYSEIKHVKDIPYKPNTLFAFMQTPISWHSSYIKPNDDPNYLRKLYCASIFFSPQFMERNLPGAHNQRTYVDEYFFDARFLNRKNWTNIWGQDD